MAENRVSVRNTENVTAGAGFGLCSGSKNAMNVYNCSSKDRKHKSAWQKLVGSLSICNIRNIHFHKLLCN